MSVKLLPSLFSVSFLTGSLFVGAFLFALRPADAAACDCPQQPSFEEAFAKSSLVFLGRVEEIGPSAYKPGHMQIKLFALKKFKGFDELPTADVVVLYTPSDVAQCGLKFQNGFEYIVYARGNPAFLQANACSRTEVLEKAQLDEQRLLRLSGRR